MTDLNQPQSDQLTASAKVYTQPRIVCELRLETRAGSPLGGDPLIDPLGLGPVSGD